MLLGSFAAPALARRLPRERLLWISVALVGVSVLVSSRSSVLAPVLGLWVLAGSGNAIAVIAYQSLLQERTPDALRGRVVAASEAVLDTSLIAGALLAGWIGAGAGVRGAFVVSGALFVVAAGFSLLLLGSGEEAEQALEPVPERAAEALA
jgi:MFS family permease